MRSHPGRGAWIETDKAAAEMRAAESRTPGGVRGLKHCFENRILRSFGRTPGGVRGLKQKVWLSTS